MLSFPNSDFKQVKQQNSFFRKTPVQNRWCTGTVFKNKDQFEAPKSVKKVLTRATKQYEDLKNSNQIEIFQKSNFSLVDMMKLKKVQQKQKYEEKQQQLAVGMQVSGMMTPQRSSLGPTEKFSGISTPRLTPLKQIERRRGENLVSKLDINALEEKIKAIESQIGQVVGSRRLDVLEKSLMKDENLPNNDDSLLDMEVPDFEFEMPKEIEIEEQQPKDALTQLFDFIEAELPATKMETYYSLKNKVLEEKPETQEQISKRKIFQRKRTVKEERKSAAASETYKFPRESIRESIESSTRVTRSQKRKNIGFGVGSKRQLN